MRLPQWIDSKDLFNTGVLGLLDAASKYDPSHKVQFKTYAELRIRGEIIDSLRQMDWVPRSLRQKERQIENVRTRLTQKLCREPEEKEIASALGVKLEDYQRVRGEVRGVAFGHFQPVVASTREGDESADLIEFVPADEGSSPHLLCERSEMRRIFGRLINTLPRKERLVVTLYYYEELSMKDISRLLHVNESRVSQLHHKAIFLLKRKLNSVAPEIQITP